ncbi:Ribosome-binding factor A [Anaerolineae bacterium]|nr:Ribosome-binding factor A [Anaerolineae bacterium]
MSIKQDRVSGRIRTILSELLLREVSDPRLHGITITEVELDPELQYAQVYVNALGDEDREADVMKGLEHATGFLRREVGKRVRLRKTPELIFHWDITLERSERINKLIASLDSPPAPVEELVNQPEDADDDDD